jgi:ubiquinone/menaquinone biosynthesis C-methylase UbiE
LDGLTRWERAYRDFETPSQEFRKFLSRLRSVGADGWDRRMRVLEVCSGRGNGLRAWHALGFENVVGVDLSQAQVAAHQGPGVCVVGDARHLPFPSRSFDVAVVQGGLHHLCTHEDVELALAEMRRVVLPEGRIIIVEPWLTPFLQVVHLLTNSRLVRRFSKTFDALATMIEEERQTYEQWLNDPDRYLATIRQHVAAQVVRRRWGKLIVVGTPSARA